MKTLFNFIFILFTSIVLLSCSTTEPPILPVETKPILTLELDDVSCIEAWLQLKTKDLTLPVELTLKQFNQTGDSISQIFLLNTKDSLLYIDSLLPNQSYKFLITMQKGNNASNETIVSTMDTTSHDFTFQSWTFGTIGSSVLYDVAIINENDIWAVGEIMIADTSQNGYTIYNAVHWDGSQWQLLRIPNYDYPNTLIYGALQTIYAFSENDIWFCSYSNLVHFDGNSFLSKAQFMTSINFDGQVIKMWGSDKKNIYCVGRNGAIYHYYGTSWQRIESGTNNNIGDISGIQNEDGKYIKYCAADNFLIRIDDDDNLANIIVEQGTFFNSVWAASNRLIYTAGNGILLYRNESWQFFNVPEINTIYRIKGQSYNDIVGLSANLSIFHFNGYTWNSIQTGTNNIYLKVQIKNNIIATTGWNGNRAIITILFRNYDSLTGNIQK